MPATPEVVFHRRPNGNTRAELTLGAECVSWLEVVPFTIRIGLAEVRMDGIADVNTLEAHRMKGYSRRVVEATVERMTQGDAAISMLYGIGNLYHKFGYATVGPDHHLVLGLNGNDDLPKGWRVRPFAPDDLPAVRNLYNLAAREATGVAVRPADHPTWQRIIQPAEALKGNACRVIIGPDGELHAYAWLAEWCYTVFECLHEGYPDALAIGEVIADSPVSADGLLAVSRQWGREQGKRRVILPVPPDSHVAISAMYADARLIRAYEPCGGSMARVLDVRRLLEALRPEIRARLRDAGSGFTGRLTIRTDIGDAALLIEPDDVRVEDAEGPDGLVIEMPQTALVRLALGAFPPEGILSRLSETPDARAFELASVIFPLRYPHMYPPDRY